MTELFGGTLITILFICLCVVSFLYSGGLSSLRKPPKVSDVKEQTRPDDDTSQP